MRKFIKLVTVLALIVASSVSNASLTERVLIVLTSHSTLGNTDMKTGFWLPELTHPYYEFKKAGYAIDVASIEGGMAPLDALAFEEPDPYHQKFLNDAELMAKVMRTIPIASIDPTDYSVVLYSGGSGPMWDFTNNEHIQRISTAIYESNGIVSALCHGNAALTNIKLSNGKYLIEGKNVAAFTNEEEESLGQIDIIPYLLQDKLIERGANHVYGKAWEENTVVDGRLFTGQNPASAQKLSQEIIEYMQKNKDM